MEKSEFRSVPSKRQKAIATASLDAITWPGSAATAIPQMGSVDMIVMSTKGDPTT